ncbi:hypothetical protein [Klebsiella pneumoniae ISC21]|nr:hypothetical protein [Klebsiella pneumoniae ISC21]
MACRQQPVERSNHAAGRQLQAMVKALLGSERSMLSEICKIFVEYAASSLNFRQHF